MSNETHLFDLAPYSLVPVSCCTSWQDVMEYFRNYDQRILDHQVYVLRGAAGLEVKVFVTIHRKLVFLRNESMVPPPDVPLAARLEFAKRVPPWTDKIVDSAMLKAGIHPPHAGSLFHPSITVFYEPRALAACDSVNPQTERKVANE